MNFDELLDESFEAAVERATAYLKDKSNNVYNGLFLLASNDNVNDFNVYSYTTNQRRKCNVVEVNCIYHTIRAIHSLDDLKENFERMREIGKIKLKEFHINKQLQELEDEFR